MAVLISAWHSDISLPVEALRSREHSVIVDELDSLSVKALTSASFRESDSCVHFYLLVLVSSRREARECWSSEVYSFRICWLKMLRTENALLFANLGKL